MGAHHSHRALRVQTSGPVRAALATIVGLVVLWPSGGRPASPYVDAGVEATVAVSPGTVDGVLDVGDRSMLASVPRTVGPSTPGSAWTGRCRSP